MKAENEFDELVSTFGEKYIEQLAGMLYQKARVFYDSGELLNVAFLDESIFQICLIDILYDLKRLKEFHNVENVSYERIVAYSAGWIVRRQPFQRLNMSDVKRTQERYLYLNEKFAMTLMVEMLATKDGKVKAIKGKKAEVERLLNRLLYHLRFRNVEPRVLELLMCGMKLGLAVEK